MSDRRAKYVTALCSGAVVLLLFLQVLAYLRLQQNNPLIFLHIPYVQIPSVIYANLFPLLITISFFALVGLSAFIEYREKPGRIFYISLFALVIAGAFIAAVTNNVGSIDLLYYIGYGRKLAILHMDPYTSLQDARFDPVIHALPETWIRESAHYGPTNILFFALLNLLVPPNLPSLVLTFKLAWFALFAALAFLTHFLLKESKIYPVTRWLAICANPFVWWQGLIDAHAEMLIIFLAVVCLYAVRRQAWLATGVALGLLCGTKFVMLLVVPFFAWQALRNGEAVIRWQQGKDRLVALLAGFLGYIVPFYIVFNGADWVTIIHFANNYTNGVPIIPWSVERILKATKLSSSSAMYEDVRAISRCVCAIGLVYMFKCFTSLKSTMNLATVSGAAMLWLLFNHNYTYEWYVLWGFVFLVLGAETLRKIAFVTVFCTLLAMTGLGAETVIVIAAITALPVWWKLLQGHDAASATFI